VPSWLFKYIDGCAAACSHMVSALCTAVSLSLCVRTHCLSACAHTDPTHMCAALTGSQNLILYGLFSYGKERPTLVRQTWHGIWTGRRWLLAMPRQPDLFSRMPSSWMLWTRHWRSPDAAL
jgi:hypothetical protein